MPSKSETCQPRVPRSTAGLSWVVRRPRAVRARVFERGRSQNIAASLRLASALECALQAEVISEVLGRAVRYRQTPLEDYRAAMLRRGASPASAQDFARMVEARNSGIYDVEAPSPPPASASGAATSSFRPARPDTQSSRPMAGNSLEHAYVDRVDPDATCEITASLGEDGHVVAHVRDHGVLTLVGLAHVTREPHTSTDAE